MRQTDRENCGRYNSSWKICSMLGDVYDMPVACRGMLRWPLATSIMGRRHRRVSLFQEMKEESATDVLRNYVLQTILCFSVYVVPDATSCPCVSLPRVFWWRPICLLMAFLPHRSIPPLQEESSPAVSSLLFPPLNGHFSLPSSHSLQVWKTCIIPEGYPRQTF